MAQNAEPPPQPTNAISGHGLVESENYECPICADVLVDPVTAECRHTFCRHCVSTCFGQENTSFVAGENPKIACPRCRAEIAVHYEINKELIDNMRQRNLLRSQDVNCFRGKATTINNVDGNRTISEDFDILFARNSPDNDQDYSGTLSCDIVWGGGTVHNTYVETTCRLTGSVDAAGEMKVTTHASNGPWEEWEGAFDVIKARDIGVYELTFGTYVWHGWNNRRSTGKLEFVFAKDDFVEVD